MAATWLRTSAPTPTPIAPHSVSTSMLPPSAPSTVPSVRYVGFPCPASSAADTRAPESTATVPYTNAVPSPTRSLAA